MPKDTEDNDNNNIMDILNSILSGNDLNSNKFQSTCYMHFKEDLRRFNNNEECTCIITKRNIGLVYITQFLSLTIFL